MIVLLAVLLAAEDTRPMLEPLRAEPAPVAVGGAGALALSAEPAFELLPGGELAVAGHGIEVHPLALAGVGWDANPAGSSTPTGSAHLRLLAGLELRAAVGDGGRIDVAANLDHERFPEADGLDFTGGEARAAITRRRPDSWLRAAASLRRERTILAQSGTRVPYAQAQAALAGGGEGRASFGWASLSAQELRHLDTAPGFTGDELDRRRYELAAGGGALGWARSELGLWGGAAIETHPTGDVLHDGRGAWLVARWRHVVADRSAVVAELGPEWWTFSAATAPGADDASILHPRGRLRLDWDPESDSRVSAGVGVATGAGGQANAALIWRADLLGRLRLHDRVAAYVSGQAELRTDTGAQPGQPREERRNRAADAGLEYELRDGCALRLHGGLTATDARLGTSWDGWQVMLEVGAAL